MSVLLPNRRRSGFNTTVSKITDDKRQRIYTFETSNAVILRYYCMLRTRYLMIPASLAIKTRSSSDADWNLGDIPTGREMEGAEDHISSSWASRSQ